MCLSLNTKVNIHDGVVGKIIEIFPPDKYFNQYRYKVEYRTPTSKKYSTKVCKQVDFKC